ncbi:MAG: phosphate acyltransferase PlsX [Chitinivibrionales bacterium]|nr:phosphate acyltransferase PlsX [Chitinivibrionales bacterium]
MRPVRLAIDTVGGDHGTPVILEGAIAASRRHKGELIAYLCGNEKSIRSQLRDFGLGAQEISDRYIVVDCPGELCASDSPSQAWKTRRDSSMVRCITLQKEGLVDASVSAGDTGILLGAANFILGRQDGIARPALAALLPTSRKKPSLLLDVGANLTCRPQQLAAFAKLGCAYIKKLTRKDHPALALLNVGKEPDKGTRVLADTAQQLKKTCPNFIGYIEGSDILAGKADVIVTDGFTGNIVLKACESFHLLVESVMHAKSELMDMLKTDLSILNAENYGAAPLLGINGIILKAHGRSSPKAISNALATALVIARGNESA